MTNWKEYKLGELIETVSKTFKFSDKKVVFLNTSDTLEGKVINHNLFEPKKLPGQAKKTIQPNDILYSEIRPANKRYAFVDFDSSNYVVSTKLMVLRVLDEEIISPKYLYYFLTSDEIVSYLQMLAESRSGTFPQIRFEEVSLLDIKLPPINVQNEIVELVASLDDKIELNNQINKDLEALAQALFKQWFIDFDFPNENGEPYRSSGGEMVDSELGEIPKGWFATNYGTITKKENLKVKKSKKSISKVYSAIKTSELVLSEDYFTKQVFSKSLENYYVVESFWFAYNPSRINIGSIGLNKNEAGAVSPVYVVFSAVDNMHFYIENHLKLESIKNEIVQKCSGTVRQALNYDSLSTFPVVKPPKSLIDKFNLFWSDNSNSISQIKSETEYLIGLRDELLPKLISGELEVSDIQIKTL